MFKFLLIYFLLYGGMNFYVFWKIRAAWGNPWLTWSFGLFVVLMVIAPIGVRLLERHGTIGIARVIEFVGYVWMALAFWFLFFGFIGDVWNFGARTAAHWQPEARRFLLMPRQHALLVILIVAAAVLWGTIEASLIHLKTVRVPVRGLSRDDGEFRIVQISDVHLDLISRRRILKRIVKLVEEAKPHVFVSTGDLSDLMFDEVHDFIGEMHRVSPPYGKFACTGNHEKYAGLDHGLATHEAAGLRLLRGDAVKVGPVILAGVDDPAVVPGPEKQREQEETAFEKANSLGNGPIVLLKHRPWVRSDSKGRFDLQISGHTHDGQIFPFGFVVYAAHNVWPGLHRLPEGGWLYLSRGTGTWGPPFRLFAPPEVTLFILEPES